MIGVTNIGARVGAFTLDNISFDVPRGAYGVVIGPTRIRGKRRCSK